ncbi:MAG: DUF2442 domain-containing protein [Bacteroidota bacterium]|nr:DUF2442 domain-containing protein [Odoribacter sp.]MDP3641839.1 DUF2442 domain-containing protein [Bacteroidota bacterium]
MEKAYNIKGINLENDYLIINIDDQLFKLKLSDISTKLAKATDQEKNDYKVSPSGYGIHWRLLDEDLSINGILRVAKSQQAFRHRI